MQIAYKIRICEIYSRIIFSHFCLENRIFKMQNESCRERENNKIKKYNKSVLNLIPRRNEFIDYDWQWNISQNFPNSNL